MFFNGLMQQILTLLRRTCRSVVADLPSYDIDIPVIRYIVGLPVGYTSMQAISVSALEVLWYFCRCTNCRS